MSDNLSELLVDLASNPDRMAAYQADPERVFDEAGLSRQERAVMQSRDRRLLSDTVGAGMRLQNGHSAPKTSKKGAAKKKGGKKKAGKKR
jgi:hypothetical protein